MLSALPFSVNRRDNEGHLIEAPTVTEYGTGAAELVYEEVLMVTEEGVKPHLEDIRFPEPTSDDDE